MNVETAYPPFEETDLFKICDAQDLKALDDLVQNDYPLYTYCRQIFFLINDKELNLLYYYIVNYIRKHPYNKLTGNMYIKYQTSIHEYALFLLLKKGASDDEVYDYFATYRSSLYNKIVTETLIKLVALDLPERLLNVFRNMAIIDVIENKQRGITSESLVEKNSVVTYLMHLTDVATFTEYHWALISKLDKTKQKEFLDYVFLDNNDYHMALILKAKLINLYYEVIRTYNRKITLEHYCLSCSLGSFDISFKIFGEALGLELDQEEQKTKILGTLRSMHYHLFYIKQSALRSHMTNNKKLEEFNINLFLKLDKKRKPSKKVVDRYYTFQIQNNPDLFLEKYSQKTVEYEYFPHFIRAKDEGALIINFKKLILHLEKHDIEMKENFFDDDFFWFFHLISTGYNPLKRIEFGYHHETLIKIKKYFIKQNTLLSIEVKNMPFIFADLINIVLSYLIC